MSRPMTDAERRDAGAAAARLEAKAADIENELARLLPDRKDRQIEIMRARTQVYRDALRAIASGELTRGKAVEAASVAIGKGEPYRIAESRISRNPGVLVP